ncbi:MULTISPECIES: HU family DNA-binding protein [unclassified Lysobacter]|uniref:HU family DNA-binding protein n=1 Tax=unclassified Lysobacter TaxID=2635362 RepID=UPI001C24BCDA|nr:HU family DNA-binding protein [Lysobacter sp. MMG2]MBU8975486.1 HU family DNA-binding protein [Lysobacter sp. MMG2]
MNKAQLVESIAERSQLTKTQAEAAVNALVESVTQALKQGEVVTLVGFGTFEARNRAGRTGRNPKTGEDIAIPATIVPAFKPGKAFKDALK